jgi:hypothetical protein
MRLTLPTFGPFSDLIDKELARTSEELLEEVRRRNAPPFRESLAEQRDRLAALPTPEPPLRIA